MTEDLDQAAIITAALLGLLATMVTFIWMIEERSRAAQLASKATFGAFVGVVAVVLIRGALRLAGVL
jgi:hypothetical protein